MIIITGKKSSRIDVDGLKNHYGRLLTWLDLQLITKGLVLIYDSFDLEGRSKNDLDFQKLAIANTWFSMSKTCNDLEDDILQVCKFLFFLIFIRSGKGLWRNDRNTPKNCIFWKYIVGGSYNTPGLDGGWFFGPKIQKSAYQDLSNEGSKTFLSSLELGF